MAKTDEVRGVYAAEREDSINNARAMIGWDRPIAIEDDSDLRKYRIELPNLYDDSDLDPYEFRLLAHYKRVGICTESSRTTAKLCQMSPMAVSEKRKSLRKKGFIVLTAVKVERGFSYKVRIVDKWEENFIKYSKCTPGVPYSTPQRDKESTTTAGSNLNIFEVYQNNIAMLTPMMADTLQDAEKTYPLDWIKDAVALAVENNKRNWRYCETILKRWQANGKDDGRGKPQPTAQSGYATL